MTYSIAPRDQVKELSSRSKLNDHEDVRSGVDELIVLDYVRVVELSQYLDLSLNLLEDPLLLDLLLVEDLYSDLVACNLVEGDY